MGRGFQVRAAEYEALKQTLAAQVGSDAHACSDGKTEFITAVEVQASAWRLRSQGGF